MNNIKEIGIEELKASVSSILQCNKSKKDSESVIAALDAERVLLSHLWMAMNLVDRGTD